MIAIKLRHLTLIVIIASSLVHCITAAESTDSLPSADLPLEARDADSSSQEEDLISSSYVLPNQIFNDGKPYYASKDPVSGQPDFNAKKPAGIETDANEVFDPKEKIVLSSSSPNIHDYLNLPVKYSSSKFVYPLVSSSYANLKYQGSNKNYITNKKPTSVGAPITPPPSYHSQHNSGHNYYTVPTTKLMAVLPTAATSGSSTTSANTTSKAQPNTTAPTSTKTTTRTTTTTPASTSSTYTTTSRKPTTVTTTTVAPRTSTTRKKFIPTKKYSSTTAAITTVATASTPLRLPNQPAINRPTTTTTATTTTRQPAVHTHPQSHPQSHPQTQPQFSHPNTAKPSTTHPIIFTEGPSPHPSFSPLPISSTRPPRVPDMEPADIYQTLGQKHNQQEFGQKPSKTLADIFNSLAEEESAVLSHNQGSQGFDAQGNLMQPITLSKPAPFAAQQSRPQTSVRPMVGATPTPSLSQQQQKQHLQHGHQPPLAQNEQKVISGSQENYSNEYVSYQVQQPNVMQYRPVPGAINNVVISPGQNSATFVLGSQQQVGVTNTFGSVEKEPLFSKEPPVQYGTVISEDISSVQRIPGTSSPQAPNTIHHMPSSQMSTNFHQAGSNAPHSVGGSDAQFMQTPGGTTFHESAPVPPSPYQQLPLINSNKRPLIKPQQQQQQANPTQSFPSQNQQEHQTPQTQAMYQQNVPSSSFPQTTRPQNAPVQQSQHKPTSINISGEQATQELLVSTNIRFPETDETSVEVSSGPVMTGPPVGPQINGHAQPLSLQQIQQSNPVVFPKVSENDLRLKPPTQTANGHNIQPNDLPYQSDIQIQQHEVLTMNQHKQKLNFPQNEEPSTASVSQHIPSQHMEPPPRFPPTLHSGPASSELQEPHKRPQPNRPHPVSPHTPAYKYSDYTRKPIPGITRPNPELHLPNILPQFRPNAKISSGHPSSYNHEPGNIRIPTNQPPKRPMNSPQFAHRHQSIPQAQQQLQQLQHQQRYPMKRIAEYPTSEANRRVYRLPPPHAGGQYPQFTDRMYARRPTSNGIVPSSDSFTSERHAVSALNNEPYRTLSSMVPETSLDKLAAFEEEDLVINDPPQPVTPSKDYKIIEEETLEPVVTLQMLQSQKKGTVPASLTPNDDSGSGEIQVPSTKGAVGMPPYRKESSSQNGLYVVYPMREEAGKLSSNEAVDLKDTLPGVAHIEGAPTTGSGEYQNTPFSVLRDQPQEPILMVKNKKPQSLQQQTKQAQQQAAKDKFPYPIEKPDSSYSGDSQSSNRMPGVLIAPRIINGAYATGTAAPIAIAYTPTEPNPYRHHATYQKQSQPQSAPAKQYSNVNLASSVIGEIRPSDTQTEEGFNNDFDLRGQNYENDFMAPFYPSVSLGSATNKPSNGWNILPSTTESALYLKNLINRADVSEAKYEAEAVETTTKSFELDSFQPELQGGFQPIYPPDYKVDDAAEEVRLHDGENSPVALASHGNPPTSAKPLTQTTTTTTSTTTTTTPKPKLNSPTPSIATTRKESEPVKTAGNISTSTQQMPTSTSIPTTTKPTLRKKSTFETSLAALLFGEEEDFEEPTGEARKDNTIQAISGPHNSTVPRSGPRSLKLS